MNWQVLRGGWGDGGGGGGCNTHTLADLVWLGVVAGAATAALEGRGGAGPAVLQV